MANWKRGTSIAAASSGSRTAQFSSMFRSIVAISPQKSAERNPVWGLR